MSPRPRRSDPYVPVLRISPNPTFPGSFLVTIKCPFCKKRHTHGYEGSHDPLGHRISHCADRREGAYFLMVTADTEFTEGAER